MTYKVMATVVVTSIRFRIQSVASIYISVNTSRMFVTTIVFGIGIANVLMYHTPVAEISCS